MTARHPLVLSEEDWRPQQEAHERRADALTAAHRARSGQGQPHPVEDFLFTYYSLRPSSLRRWHPGTGRALAGHLARERLGWRFYRALPGDAVGLDDAALLARRRDTVVLVRALLAATAGRPAHLGCFGLHEWAMVYRQPHQARRHAAWPLRLGPAGTDGVVERSRVRCTHYDAFRFFAPDAAPRNAVQPQRRTQVELEQPGCLHATMDLYKWAYKLSPAVPGDLLLDCFELARDVRTLDMRASPYDLAALGYSPVRVETADGRAEYVEAQRASAERARPLRARLVAVCDELLGVQAQP